MLNDVDSDVAKLLDLKRNYRQDCAELEAEITIRLNLEQAERKKELISAYVEKLAEAIAEHLKPLLLEVLKD